ncbi:MAG: phytanoyl-CoA dioxygenase family protein [Actinomycetota bacterium]|nr:phytanoyl-CoA dioxygenase family protein [Actinomycetota bacterium]
MSSLSEDQIDQYAHDGYLHPIEVMSEDEADKLRTRFEQAERDHPEALHAEHRNNAHYVFQFLADVAKHPAIVEAASSLVGNDLLLSSSVLFIKEPTSSGFVSWHQDARYMGLSPHDFVTAWVAITPSTTETGCMMVIPGSHHAPIQDHVDTFAEDNILTRGQSIGAVDESAAVPMELRAGQMSLHHPRLVHGSAPNLGPDRRIGLALQSYLGPNVKPATEDDAMLIAGEDTGGHFRLAPHPIGDCAPEAVEYRAWANANMSRILYDGAEKVRGF